MSTRFSDALARWRFTAESLNLWVTTISCEIQSSHDSEDADVGLQYVAFKCWYLHISPCGVTAHKTNTDYLSRSVDKHFIYQYTQYRIQAAIV